jgi:hypothetical protein
MLASKRKIKFQDRNFTTPILLPSFSSKGFPSVKQIIETMQEFISYEMLISAYDVSYFELSQVPMTFSSLVFLDSGGYEASLDSDISDLSTMEHFPREWDIAKHNSVLASWDFTQPTVLINYDHPNQRLAIEDQINIAIDLHKSYPNCVKEILLKPEKNGQDYINIDSIIKNIYKFSEFNILGFTEKEIGKSVFERMLNIAKIRTALNSISLDLPIHVFGSLDPVTSPLYFLSGADIFDGLTWLRYAYKDGVAIYKQNFCALSIQHGMHTPEEISYGSIWSTNYYYLRELQDQMKEFLGTQDYTAFKYNGEFFSVWIKRLQAALGGN